MGEFDLEILRNDSLLAFAKAIDSWGDLERQMLPLFASVNKPYDYHQSAEELYSIVGYAAQRKTMLKAGKEHLIDHPELLLKYESLLQELAVLTDQRNAIIHGQWQKSETVNDGVITNIEYRRVFRRRAYLGPIVSTPAEEADLLGRQIFGLEELSQMKATCDKLQMKMMALTVSIGIQT